MEFGVKDDQHTPKVALHVQTDYFVMGINQGEKDLTFAMTGHQKSPGMDM